jgi:hypothetical protein
MCSTDCPAAHGQKYVSEYGEVIFRLLPFACTFKKTSNSH